MNKKALVNAVAEKTGLTKIDSKKAVESVIASLEEALVNGEKVGFVGFGTFEVKERAARTCKKIGTGETIEVPAANTVKFKAGKPLKAKVNN